jgi:hypothetical protein
VKPTLQHEQQRCPPIQPPPAGQLLQKLLSVTKPTGFFSHIHNAGTDNEVLDAAKAAHAAGKGPAVAATLVQPNGAQLQEVGIKRRHGG